MAKKILKATQNRAVVAIILTAPGTETISLATDLLSVGQAVDGATQTVDISAIVTSSASNDGKITITRNSNPVWVSYGTWEFGFNGYALNEDHTSDITVTTSGPCTVILELAKTGGYTATIPNVGISGAW